MTYLENYRHSNPFMDYNHIEAVDCGPDDSEVTLIIRPESRNAHGVVHGGMLFSMADCVAGLTARGDGRDYVTQSCHMNFMHNVSEGTLHAVGHAISRGGTVVIVRVEIRTDGGKLLAEGTVDMFCVGARFGDRRVR